MTWTGWFVSEKGWGCALAQEISCMYGERLAYDYHEDVCRQRVIDVSVLKNVRR
jgi:hypothetical protein